MLHFLNRQGNFLIGLSQPEKVSEDYVLYICLDFGGHVCGWVALDKTAFVAHPSFPADIAHNAFLDSEYSGAAKKLIDFLAAIGLRVF